jgi:hypothetical protein
MARDGRERRKVQPETTFFPESRKQKAESNVILRGLRTAASHQSLTEEPRLIDAVHDDRSCLMKSGTSTAGSPLISDDR